MLVNHAVFVGATFHQTIGYFVKIEFLNIVGQSASAIFDRPAAICGILMENLEVRRIHGIFHGLKPIAVELRLNKNLSSSVFSEPDVEIVDHRRRSRAEGGPVESH